MENCTQHCHNSYAFFGNKTKEKILKNQICVFTSVVTVFIFLLLSAVSHETEVRGVSVVVCPYDQIDEVEMVSFGGVYQYQ